MEKLKRQTGSEIKQLPFMLCKLLGGVMAAVGFPGAVFLMARKANASSPGVLPFVLVGIAGMVIFVASSKTLSKRAGRDSHRTLPARDRHRISIVSWTILLILAAVFLLVTFFMTRQ